MVFYNIYQHLSKLLQQAEEYLKHNINYINEYNDIQFKKSCSFVCNQWL